jgi:hypothetical protein
MVFADILDDASRRFPAMSDRSSVITYLGLLLRQMNELTKRIEKNHPDIKSTQEEARAIRRRWDACMRELNYRTGDKLNPSG